MIVHVMIVRQMRIWNVHNNVYALSDVSESEEYAQYPTYENSLIIFIDF